ncbi:MAG: type III pantothenate kinase [Deltaproteobacteria bacterium]|nr:type III pantothenate kinase [Deltaproteobacteria bacterium]
MTPPIADLFLAIDVGNTNIVCALHDGVQWHAPTRTVTMPALSDPALEAMLRAVCAASRVAATQIAGIGVASVVPSLDAALHTAVQRVCTRSAVFVTPANYPHPIRYPLPHEIGADRLADAAAALAQFGAPALVIDFGTATTFDYLDASGAYCGGPIAPGVHLSQEALSRAAAKLPEIAFARPAGLIPHTTVEAMQAGLYYGAVGAVDGIVERMLTEIGASPQLIATGGLAPVICPHLRYPTTIAPLLTLEGIRLLTAMRASESP